MEYPLEERTFEFSRDIISFCKKIPQNQYNKPLISQVLRSATSIGANYCEANGASSKCDSVTKYIFAKKRVKRQGIG